ncbi:MAG: L-aspartate oxidase [Deltaproteobacteria bacterium]|nr:L-aspartate oxidase [Deltaproteobacteria bacterium]
MELVSDFLVIGSGIAGLSFALKTANFGTVTIVTKKEAADSNTNHAQGGIASVFSDQDSFDLHIKDTLEAGDGICNREVVETVVKDGPVRIKELIKLGVEFNKKSCSSTSKDVEMGLDLSQEGGHSRKRIVHSQDMTGKEVEKTLLGLARSHNNIRILENHIAIDLITRSTRIKRGAVTATHEDYCCGAYVLDTKAGRVKTFCSKITLLSSGGAGKVYLYTSNPDIATGDGIAMGYRAGTSVANLEFVQFHPTCLYHPDAKNFLISEAVRGEGGCLIDFTGKPFMEKYSDQKDLACRDIVARAIDTELKKSGQDSVFLDISHKPSGFIKNRFPNLYKNCNKFGFDMTKDPLPVVPAAHYMCGGIATDMLGRTDINCLFAVGETACTGLHGANRLASNSLLEALVYAHKAAQQAVKDLQESDFPKPALPAWDEVDTTNSDEQIVVTQNWDEIRRFMWNYVGIVRSDKRLARAKNRIELIAGEIKEYYWHFKVTADLIELRNLATVAELIIECALHRKESRGLHYNIEYPERNDDRWNKDTVIRRPFVG